ncbi:MAG: acyltransferase [bacterium]|nr:acyltransferase [bacterium]
MSQRLGVLDGLRGIAVLLVLWYHVWEISWYPAPFPWLQFVPETGFIGVHLFFFLSGFVIAYPFVRAAANGTSQPTWAHFAWRRAVKIVPSYALSIAIAYAIGYAALVRWNTTPWQELWTHALFIHTWWPQTYGSINGVLWTLAVEVEFYALFPLVWWCFRRAPIATWLAMIAFSFAWRAYALHCCAATTMPLLSENLPGYLDILGSGMLCAWLYVRFGARARERGSRVMPLVALAGAVALVALLEWTYGQRLEANWEVASQVATRPIFGLAFVALAFGALCSPDAWQRLLANRPLRFLAIVSYNLYLYHQMIARELVRVHVPAYHGDPHFDPHWQLWYTVVASLGSIAFAAAITYGFERPLLTLREPRLTQVR